jgi:hypothetical protein
MANSFLRIGALALGLGALIAAAVPHQTGQPWRE